METLLRDIRYAIRTLRKAPGLTVVIVVSIALAIAANATVFSLANRLIWGVLPVRDPGRMVVFSEGESFSYPDYIDYRDQSGRIFEGGVVAHFLLIPASLGGKGRPERVWGQAVSGNYFTVLGLPMALGRPILPQEDQALGRDAVVVLSHELWQRRFGSDPRILGNSVILNGRPYTVVGIAPVGFHGIDMGFMSQFWVPLDMAEQIMPDLARDGGLRSKRDDHWLMLNARLAPGATLTEAIAAINVEKKRLDDTYHKNEKHHRAITLQAAGGLIAGSATPVYGLMGVLMVVAGLVLVVACANVANLLLARAAGRQKEIAIRLAVGGSRSQLVRQLLTESVLLAVGGAVPGFLLAAVAAHAISSFRLPVPFPIVFNFDVNFRVAAFTFVLALVTALLFGLAPALRATRPDLLGALNNESAVFGRRRRFGMRNVLVVVQVALSMVLLATGGLFVRSLGNASSINIGFNPQNILMMTVDPKLHGYSHDKSVQFLSQLRQRVSALPGVRSVSFVDSVPLSIGGTSYTFDANAEKAHAPEKANADVYSVGSGYFRAMGIPLLRGRDFDPQTHDEHTAIINETMAHHLFPNQDPMGRVMRAEKTSYTVIGVVQNSKSRTLGEGPVNCAYLSLEAAPEKVFSFFGITTIVKTSVSPMGLARPVRDQIAALDPNMAVFNIETMQEHVDRSLLLPRISALLLVIFGAVGLTLAAIGLYGVIDYSVRRRTREIGIRMALGARPGAVLKMFVWQGLVLTGIGLVLGLGIALGLGRFTASLLYGISGTDLATFVIVPVVLLVTAFLAIVIPALRAARVLPATALRYE
jgi:putative ABC transport system permease protein